MYLVASQFYIHHELVGEGGSRSRWDLSSQLPILPKTIHRTPLGSVNSVGSCVSTLLHIFAHVLPLYQPLINSQKHPFLTIELKCLSLEVSPPFLPTFPQHVLPPVLYLASFLPYSIMI